MKKLLLPLLLIPVLGFANNSAHLTANDAPTIKNLPCNVNVNLKLDSELTKCLNTYKLYDYTYFVWPDGEVSYNGKKDGDLYRGRIELTMINWASL